MKNSKQRRMSSAQYSAAITALELNQVSAAAFMDISVRTSHGYAHKQPIPHVVKLLLELMIAKNVKPEDLQ